MRIVRRLSLIMSSRKNRNEIFHKRAANPVKQIWNLQEGREVCLQYLIQKAYGSEQIWCNLMRSGTSWIGKGLSTNTKHTII